MKRPPRPTQLHPQPLADADLRQMQLASELDYAQAQATETRREVERISGDHLEAAMRRSRAERTKRIDDPELTPADREILMASLADGAVEVRGWRPPLKSSRKDALLRFWGRNRHHAPAMIRAFVLLAPVCTFAFVAYRNTGERAWARQSMTVDFASPNGSHYIGRIDMGDEVLIVRRRGRFFVRRWEERQGYSLGEVD